MRADGQGEHAEGPIHYRSSVVQRVTSLLTIWWSPKFQRDIIGEDHRGLSTIEVRVLWTLGSLGPSRPSEIAAALGSGAPSVSKTVTRLETAGLVIREQVAGDQRSHVLHLTAAGRRTAQALYDVGDTMAGEIFADWDPDDVAQFTALLDRFVTDSERYARRIHTDPR